MKRTLPNAAIFLGAFLLFGVQPMLGRTLLPSFGGTAAVWTVCLAAYQTLLLAGYFYAHAISKKTVRAQRVLHAGLLALAVVWTCAFAALRPLIRGRIGESGLPALEVLFCVLVFAGLPYTLLSANASLVQAWLARSGDGGRPLRTLGRAVSPKPPRTSRGDVPTDGVAGGNQETGDGRAVYRLYAVSNLGAFCGLLAYPLLVEPRVPLTAQWWGFAAGLAAYAALLWRLAGTCPTDDGRDSSPNCPRTPRGCVPTERTPRGCVPTGRTPRGCVPTGERTPRGCVPTGRTPRGCVPTINPKKTFVFIRVYSWFHLHRSMLPPRTPRGCVPTERTPRGCVPTGELSLPGDAWLWFTLPAASCFLLNSVTAYLSNDITPFPLLWIILLGVFLCSYISAFSAFGERSAGWWGVLALVSVVALAFAMRLEEATKTLLVYLPLGVAALLFGGMFLHGWLYRARPAPAALTRYYLLIAAGGAVGGVAASVVAPLVFSQIWEFPAALLLLAILAALYFARPGHEARGVKREAVWLLAGIAVLLVGRNMRRQAGQTILSTRNFYGTCKLVNTTARTAFGEVLTARALKHGSIIHGIQYREAYLKDKPTAYFGASGGGLAFSLHTNRVTGAPLRAGLIGLGIGTLACHGRAGDLFRFYEINPQVAALASDTNHFTYLSGSPAAVEIALGDARKSLERECAAGEPLWDVIVLDAYSGDSVPLHLTTREAFELYLRRLAPDGILAAHITNWHIDLSPLCKAVAGEFGLYIESALSLSRAPLDFEAYWVFFSRVPLARAKKARRFDWDNIPDMALPTDDKGHITSLIRFSYKPRTEPL